MESRRRLPSPASFKRNGLPTGALDLQYFFEEAQREVPLRLRRGFLSRPWPEHSLLDKIVDLGYVPAVHPTPGEGAWQIEILKDKVALFNDQRKHLNGDVLLTFNLMLLTRDWALTNHEMASLVFDDKRSPTAIARAFVNARIRLNDAAQPERELFTPRLGDERGIITARRLAPEVVLLDRR